MDDSLAGKKIVVGVSGSIAAFKVAGFVSTLAKAGARVSVIMTEAACRFVTPLTFSALSGEKTYTSMFDDPDHAMAHIELAREADLFLLAPATAQTISRLAHGSADDLLSAAVLATTAKIVVCPAMNPNMYSNQATRKNINILKDFGFFVLEPETGMVACKDEGQGRLVAWEAVEDVISRILGKNDLAGQRVLVTGGPTREPLDPARFLSNRSSGKMGYALAREAWRRGAEVVLVSGPTSLSCSAAVRKIDVISAEEMFTAVRAEFPRSTIVIKAAAVSDFRPKNVATHKVKKIAAETCIELKNTTDILYQLGKEKEQQILVGFAAETRNLIEEGKRKLHEKNLDLIVINNINDSDAGFESETNRVTILDKDGIKNLPLCSKTQTANLILDEIVANHLH